MNIPFSRLITLRRRGIEVCPRCGIGYHAERVDGVVLADCPGCRADERRQWEDARAFQQNMTFQRELYRKYGGRKG